MARIAHFEIRAKDPERAINFYKNVFNWEIKKWPGQTDYWLVMTGRMTKEPEDQGYGIDGGITSSFPFEGGEAIRAYVNTMDVEDIDQMMEQVVENGGKIVAEKTSVTKAGWLCYCLDTEDNYFGMMQADNEAP
jgi:predicted enzyme related to lactoylglutathione lyase